MKTIKPLLLEDLRSPIRWKRTLVEQDCLNLVCNFYSLTTAMSLCLSEKCKDYNSCHSDAVMCRLCNCWSDSGCRHSDVKNDIVLRNDLSYGCFNCLIK